MDKSGEINDLDVLFPEATTTKTFTARDKKRYTINFFIPAEIVLQPAQKEDENSLEYQTRILEVFLLNQNEIMNKEWIGKNIPLPIQNYIYSQILIGCSRANKLMGEEVEAVMPKKKPDQDSGSQE